MSIFYVGDVPFCYGELQHFGIKGQKWGIRRFQNPDGTFTEEGKRRYKFSYGDAREQLGFSRKSNSKDWLDVPYYLSFSEKYAQRDARKYTNKMNKDIMGRGNASKLHEHVRKAIEYTKMMARIEKTAENYRRLPPDYQRSLDNLLKDMYKATGSIEPGARFVEEIINKDQLAGD